MNEIQNILVNESNWKATPPLKYMGMIALQNFQPEICDGLFLTIRFKNLRDYQKSNGQNGLLFEELHLKIIFVNLVAMC